MNDIQKESIMGVDLTRSWELVKQFFEDHCFCIWCWPEVNRASSKEEEYARRNQSQSQSLTASSLDGVGVLQEKLILLIAERSMHLAGESEQLKVWS